MRIGELATQAGVSVRALRYYEEQALLESERSPSGQRHYPGSAVQRVRLVQQLYAAGLSSKDIVELLPCMHTNVATPEMLVRLTDQRARIDRQITELATARARLDDVIGIAEAHTVGHPVDEPARSADGQGCRPPRGGTEGA